MKNFLKKHSPSPEQLKEYKLLNWLIQLSHDKPGIFGYTRASVAPAFAIGLFWAMIPMPMQMFVAAYCAYRYSCNIPIAVVLVWISNPITVVPLYYYEYLVGSYLLDTPLDTSNIEFTLTYLYNSMSEIWKPLYLGGLIFGVTSAAFGYLIVNSLWVLQIMLYKIGKKNARNKKA